MSAKTVVLVEDLDIVREGLRALLAALTDYEIVGEAADGIEAVRIVAATKPDIVLMDLHMPAMDGTDAIREIKKQETGSRVIALTADSKDRMLYKALSAGVDGYILKNATSEDLLLAMETVLDGKPYISPDISPQLIAGFLNGGFRAGDSPLDAITEREQQVLKLIVEGLSNKGIAEKLCISPKTVEKHKANLKKKLGYTNTAELVSFSIDNGLFDER